MLTNCNLSLACSKIITNTNIIYNHCVEFYMCAVDLLPQASCWGICCCRRIFCVCAVFVQICVKIILICVQIVSDLWWHNEHNSITITPIPTPSRLPGSTIRYLRQLHEQWRPVVGASAVESITRGVGDGDSGGVGGGKDVTGGQQRPSGGDGGVRRAALVEAQGIMSHLTTATSKFSARTGNAHPKAKPNLS